MMSKNLPLHTFPNAAASERTKKPSKHVLRLFFLTSHVLTSIQHHVLFPQGVWLTAEESRTPKGGMAVNKNSLKRGFKSERQSLNWKNAFRWRRTENIRFYAPEIVDEMPEEAAFHCDQHGMLTLDFGNCTPSEKMKICSASIANCEYFR